MSCYAFFLRRRPGCCVFGHFLTAIVRPVSSSRYTWVTGREPLTYYDMNLSAQDHQTFFTCDSDHLRPADASEQTNAACDTDVAVCV